MKKTLENILIALQAPAQIEKDFYKALEVEAQKSGIDLQVPKTFTGDAFGTESQNVTGKSQVSFKNLANGLAQFPQGEHFMICNIRVYEGVNASVNATDWVAGVATAELKNATIDITNNGLRIYKDVPLLNFTRSEEQNDSGYLVLTNPSWWLAQTDFEITLKSADGTTFSTADLNVRFELSGCKYIS